MTKPKKALKNRGGKLTVPSFNKPTKIIHTCVGNIYLIARILQKKKKIRFYIKKPGYPTLKKSASVTLY